MVTQHPVAGAYFKQGCSTLPLQKHMLTDHNTSHGGSENDSWNKRDEIV